MPGEMHMDNCAQLLLQHAKFAPMEDQLKEILWERPHLRFASVASGRYCLVAEGMLVNDLVEDFLWDEYEYAATSVEMASRSSVPVYYNYLPADLPLNRFLARLGELDQADVERAFSLEA
jgi:hypothetical protein